MTYSACIRRSLVVLVLAGASVGCNPFRKKTPAAPPLPPPPFPQEVKKKPAPPAPLPSPPPVATSQTGIPTPPGKIEVPPQPPPAPQPKPKGRRGRRNNPPPPVEAASVPETQPNPAPNTPTMQLGTVLTPQQRAEYIHALEQSLVHAEADVGLLKGKSLTTEQSAAMDRIASFINQARENRDADPALAARLAERAELLARDLVGSVR